MQGIIIIWNKLSVDKKISNFLQVRNKFDIKRITLLTD